MDVEFVKHQFEDRQDGVVTTNKFKLGVRHIQMTYMLLCAASLGALRGSTGIAVLALNDVTRQNDTYIQVYDWGTKVQGAILSSYLFGYAAMLVPAELLLKRINGKHIISAVLIVTGALAVAMPTIVNKGSWIALCNAQIWMGAAQACLTPSNDMLLWKFLPPSERGVFSFLVHSGTLLGITVGLPVSAVISEARLGWELVFYSQAMTALSMACLWGLLTFNTPRTHQVMGDSEKEFIRESQSGYQKKILYIPWRSILESRQVWAVICAHIASNVLFIFFLFYIPVYMQMFGNNMRNSSWKSILPFIAFWFIRTTTSPTIDWICRVLRLSFQVRLTNLRKFINFIGAFGVVAGLTVLQTLTPDWGGAAVVVITIILGVMGLQLSGFLENYKDMSENYSGTLFMISRAIASLIGALVPIVVGLVLSDKVEDLRKWKIVFLMLVSIYVVCNLVYMVFANSDRQYWDGIVVKNKFGYHNAMIDSNHLELEEFDDIKKHNTDDVTNTPL